MRSPATEEYEKKELEKLNPAEWMIPLLAMNPEYVYWGPHEDYMWKRGKSEGLDDLGREGSSSWDSRVLIPTWKQFYHGNPDASEFERGGWTLDEMNECVHFYFEINRESKNCEVCDGQGYHPDAMWISESFYSHSSPFTQKTHQQEMASLVMQSFGSRKSNDILGRGGFPKRAVREKYGKAFEEFCHEMETYGQWNDRITQDEVQALLDGGRLWDHTRHVDKDKGWVDNDPMVVPTAEEVNAAQRRGGMGGHDAINRGILIRQRCKRLGVPLYCEKCKGDGSYYVADECHVSLILWWLHPRKGCSRGIEIKRIEETDLPEIFGFLNEANERNMERFKHVAEAAKRLGVTTKKELVEA
jgi:hypothetical protein